MRLDDWPARLSAVIEGSRCRAFVYGEHDCCTFAADCIEAVTGRDVAASWRGRYGSTAEGLKVIGVKTLRAGADRLFKRVPVAFAQRGDLAVAKVGAIKRGRPGLALVIVDGAFLRGPSGGVAPRNLATLAWRVE